MNTAAKQIARAILTGFERHFSVFQEITSGARQRFENADWEAVKNASVERISFYDLRVREAVAKIRGSFPVEVLDEGLWQRVKLAYSDLLERHMRPELAETFYNSVFCRLFHRRYYDNDKIFIKPVADRAKVVANSRVFMAFHPKEGDIAGCVWDILSAFYFALPYEDIERDCYRIARAFHERSALGRGATEELCIELLEAPFYRNKAAYLIGRVGDGRQFQPFIIPLMNNEKGGIYADTLLTTTDEASIVFSFSRAYFMVSTPVPAATVDFLASIMPHKSQAELYMSIGFQKQAKNEFYSDLLVHLEQSDDRFVVAPGTRGLVMMVFTLPSLPYVFKVIRDRFAPQKEVTPELVRQRYLEVKLHDRVGRMADTLEFSDVAIPRDRIADGLMTELEASIPSKLEYDDGKVVINHLYIEKRMTPLNLYLDDATTEQAREALFDWGMAVKQLMAANIFPGDLLFKNFGVTRHGRVVFYDYDEICALTECNFRKIPPPRFPEDEFSAEPWYSVAPNDVFPEEFPRLLATDPRLRRLLLELHPELFDHRYWEACQQNIEHGIQADVFPYPSRLRFGLMETEEEQPAEALTA